MVLTKVSDYNMGILVLHPRVFQLDLFPYTSTTYRYQHDCGRV